MRFLKEDAAKQETIDFINRIGNSKGDVMQKTMMLVNIRRDNPFDDDIQKLCRVLLDQLYEYRYAGKKTVEKGELRLAEDTNPLKTAANKHKKSIGRSPWQKFNRGDTKEGIEKFNHAVGADTSSSETAQADSGEGMGESVESNQRIGKRKDEPKKLFRPYDFGRRPINRDTYYPQDEVTKFLIDNTSHEDVYNALNSGEIQIETGKFGDIGYWDYDINSDSLIVRTTVNLGNDMRRFFPKLKYMSETKRDLETRRQARIDSSKLKGENK